MPAPEAGKLRQPASKRSWAPQGLKEMREERSRFFLQGLGLGRCERAEERIPPLLTWRGGVVVVGRRVYRGSGPGPE